MNKQVKIQANQTLWDISLQEYGSLDGVFIIIGANPSLDINSEVALGQKIIIPVIDPINSKVVDFYNSLNYSPASGSFVFTPAVIPNSYPASNLFTNLHYRDETDIIEVLGDVSSSGVYTTGLGNDYGSIETSVDGNTYTLVTYPFTIQIGTLYYFKRTTATVSGWYNLIGTNGYN